MSALYLTTDLLFSSQVTSTAAAHGWPLELAMTPAKLLEKITSGTTRLVILDLTTPGLEIATLVPQIKAGSPTAKIVAFGPHVHDQALQGAVNAGCDWVLTRGQFSQGFTSLLAKLAAESPS